MNGSGTQLEEFMGELANELIQLETGLMREIEASKAENEYVVESIRFSNRIQGELASILKELKIIENPDTSIDGKIEKWDKNLRLVFQALNEDAQKLKELAEQIESNGIDASRLADIIEKIRSSILLLGVLPSRCKSFTMPKPGGIYRDRILVPAILAEAVLYQPFHGSYDWPRGP